MGEEKKEKKEDLGEESLKFLPFMGGLIWRSICNKRAK